MPLRHLTSREYRRSVSSLVGDTSLEADDVPNEPSDPTFADFPFRRTATVGTVEAGALQLAAEQVARNVLANIDAVLPCTPSTGDEATCAETFITTFGKRAYRRPLEPDEVMRLRNLYVAGRTTLALDFRGALGLLIEAILQSPAFYYHWEGDRGISTDPNGAVVELGPYMLASRMSYFLWGAPPDSELTEAAERGELSSEAGVEAQARRMLGDVQARDTVSDFVDDLLDLDVLLTRPKDMQVYPMYDTVLQAAMREETRRFAERVVFDGNASFLELMTATRSSLNLPLAELYEVSGPLDAEYVDAALNPAERGGLLTLLGFLANTGAPAGSAPARRGKVVLTRLLCTELPPPPPDVPTVTPPAEGVTTRQRFEQHALNPCAGGCHAMIDAIGFAFEHYDGIGGHRDTDMNAPVNSSGSVALDGANDVRFSNAMELGALLAGDPTARACFAKQWFRYAVGRLETDADRASLDSASDAFSESDGNIQTLIVALAKSRSFRFRARPADEVLP